MLRDFDSKEFEPLGIILRIPVKHRRRLMEGTDQKPGGGRKRKDGDTGGGRGMATIRRLVAKSPEVMVKVSGGARGAKGVREHLNYITRNGELVAETPAGDVAGRGEVADVARAWWENRDAAQDTRRRNSKETVNLVLSMPKGTDRDKLMAAARLFANRTFAGNHDYLLVEHRDTDHPHVHLTVRALGHNLVRLNPRKADLQAWREGLALELRAQGVAAEATPRRSRGVVAKGRRQVIRHLEQAHNVNGKLVPARGSKVQREKVADLVREVTSQVAAGENPYAKQAKWRQRLVRQAWADLASQVEAEGGEGVALAQQIRTFVQAMPPIATERDQLRQNVEARLSGRARRRVEGGAGEGRGGQDPAMGQDRER